MGVINFQEASQRIHRRQPRSTPPTTLQALLPDWLRERRADGKRLRGIQSYERDFKLFIAFAGDIPVADITTDLVQEYKCAQMECVSASTTRNRLTVVRMFCDWCKKKGHLNDNPAILVNHPRVEEPNPNPLTREQIHALLAALDAPQKSYRSTLRRNRRVVALMLYAGLRLAEVAGLEWRDIDLERRSITVRREIAKGGKPRVVPMCQELRAELLLADQRKPHWAVIDRGDTPDGQGVPLGMKGVSRVFERWLPRRGIHIHAHQLRKTFATELYVRGEDIVTIQRLLGHSDPKTTMRYIGVCSAKELQCVDQLRFREQLDEE